MALVMGKVEKRNACARCGASLGRSTETLREKGLCGECDRKAKEGIVRARTAPSEADSKALKQIYESQPDR
jgi:hypothetical protein